MPLNFLVETFSLGIKNIHLHRLRSLLTTLGIIFGVAAVIIMVAIGEGTKQAALEQLKQLGARNIVVRSVPPPESSDASSRNTRVLDYGLKRLDLKRLQELPGMSAIVPLRDTQQRVVIGDKRIPVNAMGTTPQIFPIMNLTLERGRVFNQLDYDQQMPVCVLGALAAQQMFPYQDPIGQRIQVGGSDTGRLFLEVIGVLERTGLRPGSGIINREIDQDLYFPLSVARAAFGDNIIKRSAGSMERKSIELTEIWLQVDEGVDVEQMAKIVENNVQMAHSGAAPDYEVKVPIEILRSAEQMNRMFNFIMVGIASFSLVVGGIGIMNIMLATVTERTREIGIRRALGAKQKHIVLQFLVETTVISLTGGAIGIALGAIGATALPFIVHYFSGQVYRTQIASWSVGGSFIVSGLIGIGFGLYPAIMAAKMNPIEALRHE